MTTHTDRQYEDELADLRQHILTFVDASFGTGRRRREGAHAD